jgi:hypothetical protein
MLRSWANAESTKYLALLAGPLFFPWACTRANLNTAYLTYRLTSQMLAQCAKIDRSLHAGV